jgi:hypothetical protein
MLLCVCGSGPGQLTFFDSVVAFAVVTLEWFTSQYYMLQQLHMELLGYEWAFVFGLFLNVLTNIVH